MTTIAARVLFLNGGSSSGKTTLARRLQEVLDGVWLRLGVDTLIDAAPPRLLGPDGVDFRHDGSVEVGGDFAETERHWMTGVAAMARAGALLIIEDNFLSGAPGQQRWAAAVAGLPVGWVGVRCRAEVAARRENTRADRVAGMAARQADRVHVGVVYDLVVDTVASDPDEAAGLVRNHFFG